ncbi:hypothetical protein Axi01nite_62100 [Actinoplanes xinjiangensis]|nr:hypothetical protein Axi01nite_62100 [Actinoplanes xinjiangensis]
MVERGAAAGSLVGGDAVTGMVAGLPRYSIEVAGESGHHRAMTDHEPAIVLVDDLRSFVDGRLAEVARTSSAGVGLLGRHRSRRVDELWLDHDLGGDDTIWPVVEVLERAAFEGRPFDVGVVVIHSANPAGATKMAQALRRWHYPVRIAPGDPAVGYVDGID